ncbi:MAG: L-histidine N(alpha)-methyltransferase [Bacteroidota bacterium]
MPERFQLRTLTSLSNVDAFAHDVRTGLSSSPKWLPSKYFYDEKGSKLFEQICTLPEYYLTRAGTEILQSHSHEIIGFVNHNASIIELGSGSASKTRILIEALLKHKPRLHYIPIDISRSALEESAASLLEDYRKLHITAYVGDYYIGLERLPRDASESRLFLFLGSNIGNFELPQAVEFLRRVRSIMRHEDRFLLSIDLKKEKSVLKAAYDDAQGITAAFNLNLLNRINRELDANFDLTSFRHRAHYNEQEGRIEAHLESLRPQRIRIRAARFEVDFEQGETIHTENSYKYSREQIQDLCTAGGLVLEKTWLDGQKLFSINLLSAQR